MAIEKLLTAEEIADALQVRPSTVRLWARRGWIPRIRLSPKVVRYDLDAVVDALKKRQEANPVAMVRHELNAIEARRHGKRPGKKSGR